MTARRVLAISLLDLCKGVLVNVLEVDGNAQVAVNMVHA